MVRCAQCGVHLPRSESLVSGQVFYCSAEHRRLHRTSPTERRTDIHVHGRRAYPALGRSRVASPCAPSRHFLALALLLQRLSPDRRVCCSSSWRPHGAARLPFGSRDYRCS